MVMGFGNAAKRTIFTTKKKGENHFNFLSFEMEDSSKALLMFAFKSVKEKTEKTKPKLSSTFCSQLKNL